MEFTPDNKARFEEIAARYPVRRSALLPALHLLQEQEGWLTPEAIEYAARLFDLTAAQVHDTATYYTMYRFKPYGKTHVEVCTNLSCALVGAQQVLEAFERELGVRAGETAEDGFVTLRTVECAGGCGRAVVVAIDHRYREPVLPEDVPSIVGELRGR